MLCHSSFEAHSSGVETTSSSDSESSLGSESDSESTADDPPQPPEGSSTKTEVIGGFFCLFVTF